MCRPNDRTHKHHIIPRYMGGPDTLENLVEVTVTQHAMFHFCNYQLWGNEEDRIAWRALSRQITFDEAALEAMSLGGKKGGSKHKENKTGIFSLSPEERSKNSRNAGKIGGNKNKENKTGICGRSPEKMRENGKKGGKVASAQKWQCAETGYVSNAAGLTRYQKARGIDTSKRIKVDGPRRWEITFEDGRVIVTYQTLKEWAKENGYSYDGLRNVRKGKIKNHKGIIKVVPF
jgi:hypothetical protein